MEHPRTSNAKSLWANENQASRQSVLTWAQCSCYSLAFGPRQVLRKSIAVFSIKTFKVAHLSSLIFVTSECAYTVLSI